MTTIDLSLFTKVDTAPHKRQYRDEKIIVMYRKGHRTVISGGIVNALGWKKDDKVDLYRCSNTFALKRETAGTMKLCKPTGGSSQSLVICNQKLWLETVPHPTDRDEFHAWIEGDVVFFKRTAENV